MMNILYSIINFFLPEKFIKWQIAQGIEIFNPSFSNGPTKAMIDSATKYTLFGDAILAIFILLLIFWMARFFAAKTIYIWPIPALFLYSLFLAFAPIVSFWILVFLFGIVLVIACGVFLTNVQDRNRQILGIKRTYHY